MTNGAVAAGVAGSVAAEALKAIGAIIFVEPQRIRIFLLMFFSLTLFYWPAAVGHHWISGVNNI